MIEFRNVQVAFANKKLFDNLNFTFEDGSNYWMEGNNGSGKTTLLKVLAGKIIPKTGELIYSFIDDSLDWDFKYELRKKYIHYIPTHALHDLLKGSDIFYQQRYYSVEEEIEQTVQKYLGEKLNLLSEFDFPASFQINHLLSLEITRLSNGQLKKVIILKKLLDSVPKVLIMDYPFEGLDSISRAELSEFLDYLSRQYKVQLIIADQGGSYLPKSISKRLAIKNNSIVEKQYESKEILPGATVKFLPVNCPDPIVDMRNVSIRYGEKVIIDNLSWQIKRGERWALTGRNGSGKTTLFSLIFADHPLAYSNAIYLFGKRRGTGESIWDIKNRIAYLGPEQIHFLDHNTSNLTVEEYLNQAFSTEELTLVAYFQMESRLGNKLKHLSNGELQLIMLIRLLSSKKELLLLDEPFQFLDTDQKNRVLHFFEAMLDQDTTLVLITHFEEDVARWTSKRLQLG